MRRPCSIAAFVLAKRCKHCGRDLGFPPAVLRRLFGCSFAVISLVQEISASCALITFGILAKDITVFATLARLQPGESACA